MKILFLKIAIATGLIYYVASSGKIDMGLLARSFEHPVLWVVAISILVGNIIFTAYRWKMILENDNHKKRYPLLSITRFTWIGALFSSILPGVVSGDLIKILYMRQLDRNLSKTKLVTSILLDRILGLVGLLILLGISLVLNREQFMNGGEDLRELFFFDLILFAGALCFIATLFLPRKLQHFLSDVVKKMPLLGKKISEVLEVVFSLGKKKSFLFSLVGVSMIAQVLSIFSFYLLSSNFYEYAEGAVSKMSFLENLSIIPVGLISIAIPITPSGLGVGHAMFDKLFTYFGVTNGASLFNLYFLAFVIINLLGLIPYLTSPKKVDTTQALEDSF